MAFGRLQRPGASQPMSEINMTPLIDVMLVLLVIFIITAPLMSSSLRLDLPKADGATPTDAPLFVAVAVDAGGQLFWGDEPVTPEQLQAKVRDSARRNPATEVQLRADQAVPFGRIAELIGLVQAGGLNRVGFVTEVAAAPSAK
ncbi:ExbD/TolR family protein [Pseudaquabacterium pictum]|uniref:Transport-related membrane protein n=1 Tax=Pseudaquabacterium pictum TaxID=2315236 RepID=A0A480AWM7_9BURK|nr:biopolymer transporter ExbD [Rubrivivax pictus]GCL65791.1 transport-related membrane protein [Rubrivivax pictus]